MIKIRLATLLLVLFTHAGQVVRLADEVRPGSNNYDETSLRL